MTIVAVNVDGFCGFESSRSNNSTDSGDAVIDGKESWESYHPRCCGGTVWDYLAFRFPANRESPVQYSVKFPVEHPVRDCIYGGRAFEA